jgi:predicted HAD superfamily Cof-like phosphohydrolase
MQDKLDEANAEIARLQAQVTELQNGQSAMVEKSLYRTVGRFHQKFGHPVEHTPHVPEDAQVRFRLKLIKEEFFELMNAALAANSDTGTGGDIVEASKLLDRALNGSTMGAAVRVNLPELVDAMGDLDWVVEGTRLVFGVLGEPVLREIERANMAKDVVYVIAKDEHHRTPNPKAKPIKPYDWIPPDIGAVLERQGWKR